MLPSRILLNIHILFTGYISRVQEKLEQNLLEERDNYFEKDPTVR